MPKCFFFFFSPAFEGLVWKWLTLFKRVSRGGCKQIHREAHSIHFLHPPPPQFLQHLRRLAVGLPKVIVFFVYFLVQPSPVCMFYLCCCYHPSPPHSPPPFLHSPVSVSLVDSFSSQPAEAEQCWDEHPKRNEDGKH